jgi:radical SAM superfamily enzyme YgiQ (UPF0313 family)
MKVLLVSTNTLTEPYASYPIGLDYVINAISPPHQVKAVDMNELPDGKGIEGILMDYLPDVIGLSIRNIDNVEETNLKTFIGGIRELINVIRQHSKGVIVLGGSGFTILPSELMDFLDADFGIIGEGERFPLLLTALEKNESVAEIPGVIERKGAVVIPEPWSGSFSRGSFPNHSYTSFYLKRGGILNLQTKRGCPFKCIYCTYPHIDGRQFRFTEPEEVARTARMLQDAGARYIYITDSTFNGSYEHSLKVALAFKKAGLSIPWGGFFTPTAPPRDYYRILADAGLMHVEFGTESFSNLVLGLYGKPFSMDDVFASHREAIAADVHVAHYLMLGGPGENYDTLNETLINTDRLGKSVFFVFNGVRIYPHTDLYDIARDEGQIDENWNPIEPKFYWSQALNRETVTERVRNHAGERMNWIIGSGSQQTYKSIAKLHARGRAGLLWEMLIR